MPEITDAEYAEYQALRTAERLERIHQSITNLRNLGADIDAPIKRCIMALALLGCEPLWSCCGFDYFDQFPHKSHAYGECGIALRNNTRSRWLGKRLLDKPLPFQNYKNRWVFTPYRHYQDDLIYFVANIQDGNIWPNKDSVHYSEPGTIALGFLENYLLTLRGQMQAECILQDTNHLFLDRYAAWQYPPLADWKIRQTDLFG